jgi:hypothetical protein
METIAQFDSPEDAHLFKSFLGSNGIEATVLDENMAQICWHYRLATGGVRVVLTDPEDFPAAEKLRHEYLAAINVAPSITTEVKWWPAVLLISLAIGAPLLAFGRRAVWKSKG